ncbi:MAG TPA: AAA family ATPase [Solirubrobacteraceae bacterium]|nr:AAA family ATPase [Solirubrobacteraceae bacterium]
MLVGREPERHAIQLALDRARSGASAILALVGEPGIGKTVLLDHAADMAGGMRVLRARGVESEAQIPFASLLELVRPALELLERIPEPQALALQTALALRPGAARDRFAVGAATLSLLAAGGEQCPLAVLIDDAHWLDQPSAQALRFAFRRLFVDPIAVVIAARDGEPSLLDGADLPTLRLGGLSDQETTLLLGDVRPEIAARLKAATAGNPLALLELAPQLDDLALAPEGAPLLVSERIARAFLRRAGALDDAARRALVLAAACDSGDLAALGRAAGVLEVDLSTLAGAEAAGLIRLGAGTIEFRHPLARSAIYTDAPAVVRREAHRALAAALPDRELDRRAWHLAASAAGVDESASAALAQAGARARARSGYATATAAFERAARLTANAGARARLLVLAAATGWDAGLPDRAAALLEQARASTDDPEVLLDVDELAGHVAARRGPVMRGHEILAAAAERAQSDRAVAMLAEAAAACFYAGVPAEMLATAESARARLPEAPSSRSRFLAWMAVGMAHTVCGDAASGAQSIRDAIALAEGRPELRGDLRLLPWLAVAPIFLREASVGRSLLEHALSRARAQAAVGALPFVLNLIALDHATTDRWQQAEATYQEAIALARETDQRTDLVFGLAGLARLHARRGREQECRVCAGEALELCEQLGARLHQIWALESLGALELGAGDAASATEHFERQHALLRELGITDADLSPVPELVELYARLGRADHAARAAGAFLEAAESKGQPWSLARALRCQALLAGDRDLDVLFQRALGEHERTPDAFETARTQLVYGERLRRARERTRARDHLRAALETFERLGARPWSERARAELRASGETLRRRDPTTLDELTPQELQIALLLASGRTTREAAAALFLSPKTIEYHLRHIYLKLDIHSREELARELGRQEPAAEHIQARAITT